MSFFLLNMFVALIIITFQERAAADDDGIELDRNKRSVLEFAMRSKPIMLFVPENVKSCQYRVYSIVGSKAFDLFISIMISLNCIVLMLPYYGMGEKYSSYNRNVNFAFNVLFTLEALLKLIVYSFDYFKDGWNLFDFIIVLGSWANFVITKTVPPEDLPFDPKILKLFRALRLVKLLNRSKAMRILMFTFVQSFKALPYVGALIFLLFFVYAIFGMHMFSHIDLNQSDEPWNTINRNNHFRSFFSSFQVLFRCATGENWPNVMRGCSKNAKCDPKLDNGDKQTCGSDIAYAYFISFVFFSAFLMLNLFVAVIMDNFAFLSQDESILGSHHLDDFLQAWAEFDPRGRGYIRHTEVVSLLKLLSPPLGKGSQCNKVSLYKRMVSMNMVMREDGTVGFNATFFHLCRTSLNIYTKNNNMRRNDIEMRAMLKSIWPNITKHTVNTVLPRRRGFTLKKSLAKLYVAKIMFENYKRIKAEQKIHVLRSVIDFTGRAKIKDQVTNQQKNIENKTTRERLRKVTIDTDRHVIAPIGHTNDVYEDDEYV